MDEQFEKVKARFEKVDEQFEKVDHRFESVDHQFIKVNERFDGIDWHLTKLEDGQEELKDMLRHHTTLLTENLPSIRQEMRVQAQETKSDVNLLFREVETLKRKTDKIEERLGL